ncbi:MAG: sialic acid TRAP transporter substrate-binding protein SiaP [Woeseiaceae bacterium]
MKLSDAKVALAFIAIIATALLLSLIFRVDNTRTLRWAHVYEVSSPYHEQALWAAEEFEHATDGRYRIRVYPASALGNESAINESLSLGAVDIIYTGAAFVANDYPPISLSDFPFVIENFAHWKSYRDSALFQEIAAEYGKATNTSIIGLTYYGFRHVTANRPILHPDDMRDLKIRVPNAPVYLILPAATGANASPMPFAEVYLALQQGVVDAQENPLTTIKFKRFYEVQSHINLTGHIAPSLITVTSMSTIERLGEDDAKLLRNIAWRAADRASHSIAKSEDELIDWFRAEGLIVNKVDREAFRAAVDEEFEGREYPFDPKYLERLRALAK